MPPTLVSPADNTWVKENKPTFKWEFKDPDLGDSQSDFNLQISTDMIFSVTILNITKKGSTQSYTLTTAEALDDGMYYWRVRTNDTTPGDWSDWSGFRIIRIDITPPDSITGFQLRKWNGLKVKELEIAGGDLVELSWTASDDPYFGRYEIYASTDPSVLGTRKATITEVESTAYTVEGLDPSTTYYFSVVVVDQAGWSSEPTLAPESVTTRDPLNWSLMGGIVVAVEVAIAAIIVAIKLFIKKE